MKELRPDLNWVRTRMGWDLQIRVTLPAGYKIESPQSSAQLIDLERLDLRLLPHAKSKGGTHEVSIPFSSRPTTDLTVELKDVEGKRVGGGKVVVFEDVDEK